ncbi:MAG: PEP-CTERM sorting domain-containing protein [Geobacteraceae bacterium]
MKRLLKTCLIVGTLVFAFAGTYAHAAPINWNTWASNTAGTMGTVAVSFTAGGSMDNLVSNYPSYLPASTFADGIVVSNAPIGGNGIIQLSGGNQNVNTLQFSAPVLNPVMAIWSLGQGGINASFNFTNATPTFVAGGPSNEYSGQPITVLGNTVSGIEGNGTVEFNGTFSSISWTNPVYEFWYGFNVGAPESAPVPEPGTMMLLGLGMAGLAIYGKRRKNNKG